MNGDLNNDARRDGVKEWNEHHELITNESKDYDVLEPYGIFSISPALFQ